MAGENVQQDNSFAEYDKLLEERSTPQESVQNPTDSKTPSINEEADAMLGQVKGQSNIDSDVDKYGEVWTKRAEEYAPWGNEKPLAKIFNDVLYEPTVEAGVGYLEANKRFWEDIKTVDNFIGNMVPVLKPLTEPISEGLEATIKEQGKLIESIPQTSMPENTKKAYQMIGGSPIDIGKFVLTDRLMNAAMISKVASPLTKAISSGSKAVERELSILGTFSLSGAIENMKHAGATIDNFAKGAVEGAKTGMLWGVIPAAVFSVSKSVAKPMIEAYVTGVGGSKDTAMNIIKNYDEIAAIAKKNQNKTIQEVRNDNAVRLREMRANQSSDIRTYEIKAQEMEKNATQSIEAELKDLKSSYETISSIEKEGGEVLKSTTTKELTDRVTNLDNKIKTSLYDSYVETTNALKTQNDMYGKAIEESISKAESINPGIGLSHSTVSNRLRDSIKQDNRFEMVQGTLRLKRPTVNPEGMKEVQTLINYINSFRKQGSIPLRKLWEITKDIQKRAEAAFSANKTELGTLYNDIRTAIDPGEIVSVGGQVDPLLAGLKDAKITYSKYTDAYQKLSKEILTDGQPNINRLIDAFRTNNTQVIKRVRNAEKNLPEALWISPKVERMVRHLSKANAAKETIIKNVSRDVKTRLAKLDSDYSTAYSRLKEMKDEIGDKVHAEAQELLRVVKETSRIELQAYKDALSKQLRMFEDWRKMSKLTPRSGVRSGIGFSSAIFGGLSGAGTGSGVAGIGAGVALGGASWVAATPIIARQIARLNNAMAKASYSAKLALSKILNEELAAIPTVGEAGIAIKEDLGEVVNSASIVNKRIKENPRQGGARISKKAQGNQSKLASAVSEDIKASKSTAKGGEIGGVTPEIKTIHPDSLDWEAIEKEQQWSAPDRTIINSWKKAIKQGKEIPPILLFPDSNEIYDGLHRAKAYQELGKVFKARELTDEGLDVVSNMDIGTAPQKYIEALSKLSPKETAKGGEVGKYISNIKLVDGSPAKTMVNVMEDPEFKKLNIFDKIKVESKVERMTESKTQTPYKGETSIIANSKQLDSKVVGTDTIRGCENDCIGCYANKLAVKSEKQFCKPVKAEVKGTIPEGKILRNGVAGDPATDWGHSAKQMRDVVSRSNGASFDKSLVTVTKLQNVDNFDSEVFRNLQVSVDPLDPTHMNTTMDNVKKLIDIDPSLNIVLRIRSFNSKNPELRASLDKAVSFANEVALPVLETKMRFTRNSTMDLLELDKSSYHKAGNQQKANKGFLKGKVDKYMECDPLLKGCEACGNCANVAGKKYNWRNK